uniref:Uncharacterized protein n=1 Tax=Lepeophtheirus salmonis TaxID=72036 RepID=A0A0K2T5A7_LEPSM
MTSNGSKMPSYFFKANEKVNTDIYYKVLRYHAIVWLRNTFPKDNYVFTQNGTAAHVEEGAVFLKGEYGFLLVGRLLAFVLTRREPPGLCSYKCVGGQDEKVFLPECRYLKRRDHSELEQFIRRLHQGQLCLCSSPYSCHH